jgi:hypothetical protein
MVIVMMLMVMIVHCNGVDGDDMVMMVMLMMVNDSADDGDDAGDYCNILTLTYLSISFETITTFTFSLSTICI